VREDLAPALRATGALVLYVDLWSDLKADPGELIAATVRSQFAQHEPALKRLAKTIGVSGGKLGGVEFSVDRIGIGRDVSLVQALVALSDAQRAKIVLVIDEAQHAITTEAGMRRCLRSRPHVTSSTAARTMGFASCAPAPTATSSRCCATAATRPFAVRRW
jgi:hypothetical protein